MERLCHVSQTRWRDPTTNSHWSSCIFPMDRLMSSTEAFDTANPDSDNLRHRRPQSLKRHQLESCRRKSYFTVLREQGQEPIGRGTHRSRAGYAISKEIIKSEAFFRNGWARWRSYRAIATATASPEYKVGNITIINGGSGMLSKSLSMSGTPPLYCSSKYERSHDCAEMMPFRPQLLPTTTIPNSKR
jgi:hypothetical protein